MKEDKQREAIKYYRSFFVSMLDEFLYLKCHPLYRPWSINMHILVDEIVAYFEGETSLIRKHQTKILLDEFLYLSKHDYVFVKRFARDADFLIKEIQNINDNNDVDKSIQQLAKLFRILQQQLHKKYVSTLQGLLNTFINESFFASVNLDYEKEVSKFKNVINILLAELFHDKYSRKYVEFVKNKNYYKSSKDFDQLIGAIYKLLLYQPAKYSVFLTIEIYNKFNKIDAVSKKDFIKYLDQLGYATVGKEEYMSAYSQIDEKFKYPDTESGLKNSVIIKTEFEGWDVYRIAYLIRNELLNKCDLFIYDDNSFKIVIDELVLLQRIDVCSATNSNGIFAVCDEFWEYSNERYSSCNPIERNMNLFNRKEKILDDISLKKINNSLRYYRGFLNETNKELRLLNLWIALESIFADGESSGNFEVIKKILPKVVNLYFLRETLDELQSFLLKQREKENEKGYPVGYYYKLIEEVKKNNIYSREEKMADSCELGRFNNVGIFRYMDREANQKKFLEIIKKDGPYVYNKYKDLLKIIEKDERGGMTNLYLFLQLKHSEILRSIVRIYRTRNHIVHCGNQTAMVDAAISTLEFLYFILLDDIFDKATSEDYGVTNIQEYLDRLGRSYGHYESLLKRKILEEEYKFLILPYFVL